MKELSKNGYSADTVKNSLLTNRTIKFEYELLDKNDKKIGTIDEVSGSYSFNADAVIKGAGRFTLNERYAKEINFLSERIKPYFCLKIDNDWLKWGQGIYLGSSPNRIEQDGAIYRNIDAYDKSLILHEDYIDNRYFIAKGTPYTNAIRDLILSAGIDKISIQESELTLSIDKEYDIGLSKLEIINDLLNAINYNTLYFNEDGFCIVKKFISPKERAYEFEYITDNKSIITYGSSDILDAFKVPNKFIRYVENPETEYLYSVFINNMVNNNLSTVSRGRVITDIKSVTDIADQATLDEYVLRVATEKSQVFGGIEFSTLQMPHHSHLDCLHVKNNTLGISEKFVETAWSINTAINGLMTHTCKRVVELW